MFELTNDQRKCFGLLPVEDHWVRTELAPGPYDCHTTFAYLDGVAVKKYIATGNNLYIEYELCEELSPDLQDILPKTTSSVYHIVTERKDLSIEELRPLSSLPSVHIMDNHLFYGNYEIIGNIPVSEKEDYPILYGNSIDARYRALHLQCGKLFLTEPSKKSLYHTFTDLSIGYNLRFRLSVLLQCIEAGSNNPYWSQKSHHVESDLRNPKFRTELEEICKQFPIAPSSLVKFNASL